MKKTILSVAGLCIVLAIGCRNDNFQNAQPKVVGPPPPCTDTVGVMSFAVNIAPIMNANCAIPSCHNTASDQGGYDFTTYASAQASVRHGTLLPAINHTGTNTSPNNWMPLTGTLTSCQLLVLNKWANNGAAP